MVPNNLCGENSLLTKEQNSCTLRCAPSADYCASVTFESRADAATIALAARCGDAVDDLQWLYSRLYCVLKCDIKTVTDRKYRIISPISARQEKLSIVIDTITHNLGEVACSAAPLSFLLSTAPRMWAALRRAGVALSRHTAASVLTLAIELPEARDRGELARRGEMRPLGRDMERDRGEGALVSASALT